MKLIFSICEKEDKQQYRIQNWSEYNKALCNRGSITFSFDEDAIHSWLNHSRSGKRGKPRTYGDTCVKSMLVLKAVYHLPQRATYGLVCSLLQLMNLDLPVPHPTILSRRAANLCVGLPRQKKSEPLHVLVDVTGLKVYGEGEWKVRIHGIGKRRTWRKLHIAMDADSGEILATVCTTSNVSDKEETAFFRLKTIFSDRLRSRSDDTQATEVMIRCVALNRMTKLGMPQSYLVRV